MKLKELFSKKEQRQIADIMINSNLSTEQAISILEAGAQISKEGIKPDKFFEAVNTVYGEMKNDDN